MNTPSPIDALLGALPGMLITSLPTLLMLACSIAFFQLFKCKQTTFLLIVGILSTLWFPIPQFLALGRSTGISHLGLYPTFHLYMTICSYVSLTLSFLYGISLLFSIFALRQEPYFPRAEQDAAANP
jgi:hypothetical protein